MTERRIAAGLAINGRMLPADLRRFAAKLRKQGECWEWQGYTDEKGYGQFKWRGRAYWVHRVAYATFVGDIPDGMTVDHTCLNTSCCNPDHLQLLTHAKNSAKLEPDISDIPI